MSSRAQLMRAGRAGAQLGSSRRLLGFAGGLLGAMRHYQVDPLGSGKDLPGPEPTLFFAPTQIKKRITDWGQAELGKRLVQTWIAIATKVGNSVQPWMTVQHHHSADAVKAVCAQVLQGSGDPRVGHMLSLST